MVAPLRKTNTLEQTQFALEPGGFRYKGEFHAFDDVTEIRSYRVIHQTRVVGVGTQSHNPGMSMALILRGGTQVVLTEQSTLLSTSSQSSIDAIQLAYETISASTFDSRASKYTTQVEALGYFEYAGWRFGPQQKKLTDPSGRASDVVGLQFLKSYGFIEVVPKNEGMASKLLRKSKQEITGNRYGIGTRTDTDVFFALLKHYFQLQWSA